MFYVYALETSNGFHYIGVTKTPGRRVHEHVKRLRNGYLGVKFVGVGHRLDCVILGRFEDELEAMKMEASYIDLAMSNYGEKCANKGNTFQFVAATNSYKNPYYKPNPAKAKGKKASR